MSIQSFLQVEPTEGQAYAMYALERFLWSKKDNCTFILRGYAGTGKTTLLSALIAYCTSKSIRVTSLAPTGRAAKVLSQYSGRRATTIHKHIYTKVELDFGGWFFQLKENKQRNVLFIVDEASMIGGEETGGLTPGKSLMEDLFTYVFSGKGCRLLFVGDEAQLPPVGLLDSPALSRQYLADYYGGTIGGVGLEEVVRQASHSSILYNATKVREAISNNANSIKLEAKNDVVAMPGNELFEDMESHYDRNGVDDVIFITRSNKTANVINQTIRQRIFWREDQLEVGDRLMIVKNNYYWLETIKKKNDFIANGETAEVLTIEKIEEKYGSNFATVWVRLVDHPDNIELEVIVWLDALSVDGAAMPDKDYQQLLEAVKAEDAEKENDTTENQLFRQNPHLQALQVKFAYAITCHKAQGGQWPYVFVEHGYLLEDMVDAEWLRWLYTAVTRATHTLYLVNFQPFLLG